MDADTIMEPANSDNLITMVIDSASKIRLKFLVLMYILFIFIVSDVFVDRILSNFIGATELHTVTNWGSALQGIFYLLGYIVLEILADQSIL